MKNVNKKVLICDAKAMYSLKSITKYFNLGLFLFVSNGHCNEKIILCSNTFEIHQNISIGLEIFD